MGKQVSFIRDLIFGACMGVTLFAAGYVVGFSYPPGSQVAPAQPPVPSLARGAENPVRV